MLSTNSNGWPAIYAANPYNRPPAAGTVYLIANVSIVNLGKTADPAYDLGFVYVSGDGRTYDSTFVVYKTNLDDVNTMYHGANASFVVVVQVPSAGVSNGRWLATDHSDYSRTTQAFYNR